MAADPPPPRGLQDGHIIKAVLPPLVLHVHIRALFQQRPDRLRAAFKTGENEQNLGNAVSALEALGVFDLERLR